MRSLWITAAVIVVAILVFLNRYKLINALMGNRWFRKQLIPVVMKIPGFKKQMIASTMKTDPDP